MSDDIYMKAVAEKIARQHNYVDLVESVGLSKAEPFLQYHAVAVAAVMAVGEELITPMTDHFLRAESAIGDIFALAEDMLANSMGTPAEDAALAIRNIVTQHSRARWNTLWFTLDELAKQIIGVKLSEPGKYEGMAAFIAYAMHPAFVRWMYLTHKGETPTLASTMAVGKVPEDEVRSMIVQMNASPETMASRFQEWANAIATPAREALLAAFREVKYPNSSELKPIIARVLPPYLNMEPGDLQMGNW